MKALLGIWLVLGTLLAGNARADVLQPHYLLDVQARFTVAADGTVEDIEVRGIEDEMVLGRVVDRLAGWTFSLAGNSAEPDSADPVGVTARFQLVAVPNGDFMQVRIRRPSFTSRPLFARPHPDDWQVNGQRVRRTPINHPASSEIRRRGRGVHMLDTEIVYLVEYGPDGRVSNAGVTSIDLFHVEVRESEIEKLERMLEPYVDQGARGLRLWRFPAAEGEDPPAIRRVLIPVRFLSDNLAGISRRGEWRHALSIDSMVDDWARREGDQRAVPALDDGSDEIEQRLVLLATEDELVL